MRSAPATRGALVGLALALMLAPTRVGARPARAGAPLVVLDPGHGGPEAGTVSSAGAREKDLALDIAARVRARLERRGLRVRQTRLDDRALGLAARPAIANALGAEAFVSIHLNSAPDPDRRGWETYVLSPEPSDALTRRVLGREEGSAGAPAPTASETSELDFILADLEQTAAQAESARLAAAIQAEVAERAALAPSRGLRQAPFTVLSEATVPAVLVEVGYLSNEEQARFFATARGRSIAAAAIASGILRFLGR